MKKLYLFTLISLFSISCFTQEISKLKLDSIISLIEPYDKAIGTVSVYMNGEEKYNNSFGYENIEDSVHTSSKTKYRIVSMSKMFTSTVIMKLIEEGKLTLETKLSEFYPNITNADKITIRHMLSHQSGILNYDRDQWLPLMKLDEPKRRIYEFISNYPSIFESGSNFNYSNTNYVLLGWIASDVSGESFEDLLQKVIIKPAKLEDTYPGSILDKSKNEAICYIKINDEWNSRIVEHHEFMLPDGGLVSTPSDILKFMHTLFDGNLISEGSLNAIKDFTPYNYGYGLQRFSYNDNKPLYGHSGALYSYRSIAFYCPETKISIAVLLSGLDFTPESIAGIILHSIFNPNFVIPKTFK